MAQNITLLGASYSDVPSVLLPKTGGGQASFVDITDTTAIASDVASGKYFYTAAGVKTAGTATIGAVNVVTTQDSHGGDIVTITSANQFGLSYVTSLYSATFKLSETDFNTWTPSTTATAMLATASVGTFTATDINLTDYFSRWLVDINLVYTNSTTAKGRYLRAVCDNWYCVTKRPSNLTNITSGTKNANVCDAVVNLYAQLYYSAATTQSFTYSQSYGLYTANSAPTVTSSGNSPTVTVKRPIINARCSDTYFSTAQAALVDKTNSTIKFRQEVYRSYSPYNRQFAYDGLISVWHNGL